jgi:hypothetical protein
LVGSQAVVTIEASGRGACVGQAIGNFSGTDSSGFYLNRPICQFNLHSAALSDTEIIDSASFAYPRRTNNLREWLPMDRGTARNVDFSGNGRNYTENGTVSDADSLLILARPPLIYTRQRATNFAPTSMLLACF